MPVRWPHESCDRCQTKFMVRAWRWCCSLVLLCPLLISADKCPANLCEPWNSLLSRLAQDWLPARPLPPLDPVPSSYAASTATAAQIAAPIQRPPVLPLPNPAGNVQGRLVPAAAPPHPPAARPAAASRLVLAPAVAPVQQPQPLPPPTMAGGILGRVASVHAPPQAPAACPHAAPHPTLAPVAAPAQRSEVQLLPNGAVEYQREVPAAHVSNQHAAVRPHDTSAHAPVFAAPQPAQPPAARPRAEPGPALAAAHVRQTQLSSLPGMAGEVLRQLAFEPRPTAAVPPDGVRPESAPATTAAQGYQDSPLNNCAVEVPRQLAFNPLPPRPTAAHRRVASAQAPAPVVAPVQQAQNDPLPNAVVLQAQEPIVHVPPQPPAACPRNTPAHAWAPAQASTRIQQRPGTAAEIHADNANAPTASCQVRTVALSPPLPSWLTGACKATVMTEMQRVPAGDQRCHAGGASSGPARLQVLPAGRRRRGRRSACCTVCVQRCAV